jgi:hypothetical protein
MLPVFTNSPIHQLANWFDEASYFTTIDADAERPRGSRALIT